MKMQGDVSICTMARTLANEIPLFLQPSLQPFKFIYLFIYTLFNVDKL